MDVLAQLVEAPEQTQAARHGDAAQWMELLPMGAVQLTPRRESHQTPRAAEVECIPRARRESGNETAKKFIPGPSSY